MFLADEEVLGLRSDTGPNAAEKIKGRVLETVRPNLDVLLMNIDGEATLRVKLAGLGQTSQVASEVLAARTVASDFR